MKKYIKYLIFIGIIIVSVYFISLFMVPVDGGVLEKIYIKSLSPYNDPLSFSLLKDINYEYKPLVYLYNTHPKETYEIGKVQSYNINYNVLHASELLDYYLQKKDISTYVEKEDISFLLNEYNYQYHQSYLVSRMLLEKRKEQYPSLEYFIDIHRDAASYSLSVCTFNEKKYAKILFVIGLEHDNYKENLALAQSLDNILKELVPCISRGIMEKKGLYVNGVYNQDFDPKTLLIEVGSNTNYFEEVNNTLMVLADALERIMI